MIDSITYRLAGISESETVRAISAAAYVPAYQKVIGVVPKPAFEDYTPRIRAGSVWIADVDDQPAAVLVMSFSDQDAVIYSIAVLPDAQGKGLASWLLDKACELSSERGYCCVSLYTNTKMQANRRLYARCGFRETGTRPHPSREGEELVDMVRDF